MEKGDNFKRKKAEKLEKKYQESEQKIEEMLFGVGSEDKKRRNTRGSSTLKNENKIEYSSLSENSENGSDDESSENQQENLLISRATFSNPKFLEDSTFYSQIEDEEDWL